MQYNVRKIVSSSAIIAKNTYWYLNPCMRQSQRNNIPCTLMPEMESAIERKVALLYIDGLKKAYASSGFCSSSKQKSISRRYLRSGKVVQGDSHQKYD
jgi:hypothetical protein